jgi:predicted LPLAT superfamily acyltransferase
MEMVNVPRAAASRDDWARTPERSNTLALRVMTWIAVRCGRRVTRWVLHPITLYFMLFAPTARSQSLRYLRRALGREPRFIDGYRHVHAFTATILDRVYLLRGRLDLFDIEVCGADVIEETLAESSGAFLVGAHMGSFEVVRAIGEVRPGVRVAMVMYPDNARMVNDALRAIAPDNVPKVIALGRSDSMLAVRDWLDAGGLAGFLADRSLLGEAQRSSNVRVQFLGHEAVFNDGPFRLAALLRRRVFFMVGVYLGGARYQVRFESLANLTQRMDSAEREQHIEQAVRTYAARLEALCREIPYNWFNFHDFWHEDAR